MSVRSIGHQPSQPQTAPSWNSVTDKPTTFSPASHSHVISDVNGLQAALDNAASLPVQPSWSTLAGKPSTFPPSAHTHAIADITGLQAALNAKVGLLLVGTLTVGETMTLGVGLGVRRYVVTLSGLALGDRLVLTLTGVPLNGSLQDAYVSAANTINVGVLVPAVGINATVAIPIAVYKVG